jgi:hypothetical protein
MIGLLRFLVAVLASPFKSKIRLEAENAALLQCLGITNVHLSSPSGLAQLS